mgnify:CR=1 FL=1
MFPSNNNRFTNILFLIGLIIISNAKECLFSIKSLKVHNTEKICVFSEEKYRSMFEHECDYFFSINSKIKRPKVEYMSQSPFAVSYTHLTLPTNREV